ncbi:hypothetical protein TNCV_2306741 [Trichonephila clavipes]|nr:hypothetical protein TNCV_2306741 [Trichonephila clavipes]
MSQNMMQNLYAPLPDRIVSGIWAREGSTGNLNCMYLELCELSNEASAMAPISCDASQTSEAEMDMAAKHPKVAMKPNQLKILCTTFGYLNG